MSGATHITQSTWAEDVLSSTVPVLVDFWAPWCRPCMQLGPTIDKIADEYAGRAKVVKVNVDEERGLAAVWQIMGIPALLFFSHGDKVDELTGAHPEKVITDKLDHLIAGGTA